MSNNEITIESENKLLDEIKVDPIEQNVIQTEPKTDKKLVLSSTEELERLGLREK